MNETILVTGAGGFIGGHLVGKLLQDGYGVRAVDKKPQWQWYQRFLPAENLTLTLEEKDACLTVVKGCDRVYNLAADMGGMGFVELNKGLCMLNVLINTQMLMAARACGVTRFFYSSSACVYAGFKQQRSDIPGLRKRTPILPIQWTAMAGKSSLAKGCAGTSAKTSVSKQGWPAKIMLMVPTAPSMAAARSPSSDLPKSYRRETVRPSRNRNLGRRRANA